MIGIIVRDCYDFDKEWDFPGMEAIVFHAGEIVQIQVSVVHEEHSNIFKYKYTASNYRHHVPAHIGTFDFILSDPIPAILNMGMPK